MFRDELKRKRVPNIDKELQKEFQTWFKNYVSFHSHLVIIFGCQISLQILMYVFACVVADDKDAG